MQEMKPQGKKIITGLFLQGRPDPITGQNMRGFADETGRVFYDDGVPYGNWRPATNPDEQYRFDVTDKIETPSGTAYGNPLTVLGGSTYIGETGNAVIPNEQGEITAKEVSSSINFEKTPRVYSDETSPTGYSLMSPDQLRNFSSSDWNKFIETGASYGKPVFKDGTPYEAGMSLLPPGTDTNRLTSLLQQLTQEEINSFTGSPLQGGAKAERVNALTSEIQGLLGGDATATNAFINQYSYRPAQLEIRQRLEASQNPDTSFSLSNVLNAGERLAKSVGPAIAAMAFAQYGLPALLGSSAAVGSGAAEAASLLDAAALAEGGVTAGMGAAANTGLPLGTVTLGGAAPTFTSNSMLSSLGLGAEASAPFTPAQGLPAGLFSTAPSSAGTALQLTLGDDLAALAKQYPNIPVEQLQSIAEINYGLNPTTAFDAANLAASGYTPATINQVLGYSYTPGELLGTGVESFVSPLSQVPQYPGDAQYIEQDLMEQARATNVPLGSPTSWDKGIPSALSVGNVLQGVRLASGLLSGGQPQPQQAPQQGGAQMRVPQGMVDYSGIYNLLSLQRPQNRFSLLG
jgi:hypothetical protein